MNVLVACEFSGVVREAFRARGHNAWSVDLLPAEDNGPRLKVRKYSTSTDANGRIFIFAHLDGRKLFEVGRACDRKAAKKLIELLK